MRKMVLKKLIPLFICASILALIPGYSETVTIRVAAYNLLKFPYSNGMKRISAFRTVIQAINPDVLIVEELYSETAGKIFQDSVLNYNDTLYARAPFTDGPDTDNLCFYKKNKLILVRTQSIPTYLRNIGKYTLTCTQPSDTFHIFAVHLKAGSEAQDKERRQWDANLLRSNYLNQLPTNSYFLVAGDFNLYTASEPAFTTLIEDQSDNDGQCFDPINKIGSWHNNAVYVQLHTQSTRTTVIDSGASGGLDDRFDFILCSAAFLNPGGLAYIPGTYAAFGNDGLHFNSNIHSGGNRLVNDEVALALYQASDHLPVVMEFSAELKDTSTAVESRGTANHSFYLNPNYPNPFNGETTISISLPQQGDVSFSVFDMQGRCVMHRNYPQIAAGTQLIRFDGSHLPSGLYCYVVQLGSIKRMGKMIIMK